MIQEELYESICVALNNLCNWDVNCFYYWIEELYDGDDEIWNNWTLDNLARIEKDYMYAFNEAVSEDNTDSIGE